MRVLVIVLLSFVLAAIVSRLADQRKESTMDELNRPETDDYVPDPAATIDAATGRPMGEPYEPKHLDGEPRPVPEDGQIPGQMTVEEALPTNGAPDVQDGDGAARDPAAPDDARSDPSAVDF
jgi:hypothetical protein